MQKNIKSVQSINPFKSVIKIIFDILTKGHGETLEVETKEVAGSTFIINLTMKTN